MQRTFQFLGLALMLIFSSAFSFQAPPESGPTFFSKERIEDILNHRDCTDVRFYNIVKPGSDDDLSTMAIGVNKDGSELYSIMAKPRKYLAFESVEGQESRYNPLSKSNARKACNELKTLNIPSFSAHFTEAEIEELLKVESSTGIQITEIGLGENKTFKAQPAKLTDGKIVVVSNAVEFVCGEPCPTFCGDTQNYVNM